MNITMKFELLPNEMIIECFLYLNGPEIFYSFDQLNHRFDILIQSILLHVNFQNVNKLIFMRFCRKMLSDPEIKHQIISLKLPNDYKFYQVNIFLSVFSFKDFSHLQSLTLTGCIDQNTVEQIISVLPSLGNLRCFYLSDRTSMTGEILLTLFKLKLQILSIPSLYCDIPLLDQTVIITSLKINLTDLENLYELFRYTPVLKYLNIENLGSSLIWRSEHKPPQLALCLKQLKTGISFMILFEQLESLFKHTPNLKILTIFGRINDEMIDADQWQNLITSSLYQLDFFRFHFSLDSAFRYNNVLDKFQEFQTDFWHQQHHWYTNYEFDDNSALIYTIPCISNEYQLTLKTHKYWNPSIDSNVFNNITKLYLPMSVLMEKYCHYYFRNVESLILTNTWDRRNQSEDCALEIQHIASLKKIISSFHIRHLDILYNFRMKSSFVLLEIIKETSQLSSLSLNTRSLMLFMSNEELCKYWNKMIKTLNIASNSDGKYIKSDELGLFCKTFYNLEQLSCWIANSEHFLFILRQLSKLSKIEFRYETGTFPENIDLWLEENALKLNKNCVLACSFVSRF